MIFLLLFIDFFCLSVVDGYMKTDDRMRLAKERREEKERSLGKRGTVGPGFRTRGFFIMNSLCSKGVFLAN